MCGKRGKGELMPPQYKKQKVLQNGVFARLFAVLY